MENLKIQVRSDLDAERVQNLLADIGYKKGEFVTGLCPRFVVTEMYRNEWISTGSCDPWEDCKEITLPELRKLAGKESLNNTYAEIEQVRKEYIDSAKNYTYVQDTAKRSEDWIEIPEGAELAVTQQSEKHPVLFIKKGYQWFSTLKKWVNVEVDLKNRLVLWQRQAIKVESGADSNHTADAASYALFGFKQPDPLPFIDDEPQNATESRTSNENSTAHTNPQQDANNATNANAWQSQVGGDHYKKLKIQPMEYALANKLDYAQANVVKYVTRHADKNGKEDLLKAIHNIQLMIEHYYAD